MNNQQYQKFLDNEPAELFRKHCFWVDPTRVTSFNQRARVGSNQQENINRYTAQFLNGVEQRTPVSVIPLPDGTYKVMEGVSRSRAKIIAKDKDKNQRVFVCTYQQEVLGWKDEEWEDFQDNGNDHLGSSPATDADMRNGIIRRAKSGRLCRKVTARNDGTKVDPKKDLETYANLGSYWLKEDIWPNAVRTRKWLKNRIKEVFSKEANLASGFKTYDDLELSKNYSDVGRTSYNNYGSWFGVVSGNETVKVLRDNKFIFPNIAGSVMKTWLDQPGVNQTIIVSYSNINGKSEGKIEENRRRALTEIKRIVSCLPGLSVEVKTAHQMKPDPSGFKTVWSSSKKSQLKVI